MIRFGMVFTALSGSLLLVPAATLGGVQSDGLTQELNRTLRSLDLLARVQKDLRENEPNALDRVRQFTQAPRPDQTSAERVAELERAQRHVDELRLELDLLEAVSPKPIDRPHRAPSDAGSGIPRTGQTMPQSGSPLGRNLTVGLDPDTRRALANPATSHVAQAPRETKSRPLDGVEGEGFIADPLRLGRLYYRTRKYAEALEVLEPLREDPAALYWVARSLEKLRRFDEARTAYQSLIGRKDAPYESRRADEDLKFMEWKLEFESTNALDPEPGS